MPEGIKGYVANPDGILEFRPDRCGSCGHVGRWQVHDHQPRFFSIDNQRVASIAYRCRCPRCRGTERLLPEGTLPGQTYGLETIGAAVAAYVEPATSYRSVALAFAGGTPPPGLGLTTMWGNTPLNSPTPSTVFRWVTRFAAGASAWWPPIVAAAQQHLAHALVLPSLPTYMTLKARTPSKQQQLVTTWALVWMLVLLTNLAGEPPKNWPVAMLRAEKKPLGLDATSWFVQTSRAPP